MSRRLPIRVSCAGVLAALWLLAGLQTVSDAAPQNWGNSWHNNPTYSCQVSAGGLSFGYYSVFSNTPLDSAATIRVNCTGGNRNTGNTGNGAVATLSFGAGEAGTVDDRYMTAGFFDRLQYQLYADAARRSMLGDGSRGTRTITTYGNSTVTIYGRVFARQDAYPGDYRDSVRVTISF